MKYHIEFDLDFKRNDTKGIFIAIEGNDGSGKTTQAELLTQKLSKNRTVFLTKNPTDGEIGKFIRKVLSREIVVPAVSFQYLFSADRQVQQVEIIERLQKGEVVITDRYFWSALAYGMVDRGAVNADNAYRLLVSQAILSMYHQFIIPDYTFFLDISVETSLKRLSSMNKKKELYEEEEKLKSINQAYKWLINQFPKEITVVDGEKSIEEITEGIAGKVT